VDSILLPQSTWLIISALWWSCFTRVGFSKLRICQLCEWVQNFCVVIFFSFEYLAPVLDSALWTCGAFDASGACVGLMPRIMCLLMLVFHKPKQARRSHCISVSVSCCFIPWFYLFIELTIAFVLSRKYLVFMFPFCFCVLGRTRNYLSVLILMWS